MAKLNTVQLLRLKDPSLTKDSATALVSCRNVYVDGELCTDPKQMFDKNACVEIIFPKYVSRGGFKLEKALSSFKIILFTHKNLIYYFFFVQSLSNCFILN